MKHIRKFNELKTNTKEELEENKSLKSQIIKLVRDSNLSNEKLFDIIELLHKDEEYPIH